MIAPSFLYYEMVRKRDIGRGWSKFRICRYVTFEQHIKELAVIRMNLLLGARSS